MLLITAAVTILTSENFDSCPGKKQHQEDVSLHKM